MTKTSRRNFIKTMGAGLVGFGGIDLNKYISEKKPSKIKKNEIEKTIEQILGEENLFGTERLLLANLFYQAGLYKKINLSFLNMRNVKKGSDDESYESFPKFTVHKRSMGGFDPFLLDIYTDFGKPIFFKLCNNKLPDFIDEKLIEAVAGDHEQYEGNSDEAEVLIAGGYWAYDNVSCGLRAWREVNNFCTYSHSFNGFIPQKTKEKIETADKIFGRDLFLIKETKLEDWTKEIRITKDPLIIGVMNDESYLVDHFNTTPLEDYIKSEFTSKMVKKLNLFNE